MKISFYWRGLVEGGVKCAVKKDELFVTEEVTDLSGWLKRQFLELRQSGSSSEHYIWFGEGERPFAAIVADKKKFKVYFCHPEITNKYTYRTDFVDVDQAVEGIASGACRVSSLEWEPAPPQPGGLNFYDPLRPKP